MIDRAYKKAYREIFSGLLARARSGEFDECGIRSYTHPNPLMAWLFWRRIRTALHLSGDLSGKSVLDFGCGAGVTFLHLKGKDCRVVACDNEFHEIARRVAHSLDLEASVCSRLEDIEHDRFDVVFALDVLEHVDDLSRVVASLDRLSGKETRIIVSGPTENIAYRIGRMLAGFSGHYHHRTIYGVEREMQRSGFQLESVKTLYYPVPLFRVSLWRKA